ncbi:MAG: flagellar hook-associated protein FlgK [Lachnospiraceae bacterium]|nr:flagellar hook-associated protein FlgK [Lachnospiraceae bacterium]
MPSQFFGLNTAYKGLLNANAGLNTTANNISNLETEGYSRQAIHSEAAEALRVFTTYGCAGAGVDTLSIERIHDEFYDSKYWSNNNKTGQYEMKDYYMKQIEDYFKDDSTIEGFTTTFNKMMTALAEVKKNPANISTKAQFVGFADNLCEYFNSMAGSMEQVQKDVNSEIKLKVDEINSLASEIATINKQINVIELSGGTANELRDKRTLLVDQLSSVVSIEAKEYAVVDTNDPERLTGSHMYVIKIAGGQTLVDTDSYNTLECLARRNDQKQNQSDIDGLYDVYWVSSGDHAAFERFNEKRISEGKEEVTWNDYVRNKCSEFSLYNAALGGQLQGLIQMRDGNNSENFKGTVAAPYGEDPIDSITGTNANGDTIRKVTVKASADYLADLDKCTLSDSGGLITLANQKFYYDDWTFRCDMSSGTAEYYYDFYINETKTVTFNGDGSVSETQVLSSLKGKEVEIGTGIKYQGVPYYQQQLNEWCRIFAGSFNDILTSGYTSEGEGGVEMFVGNKETEDDQYLFRTRYGKYIMDADGNPISSNVQADGSYTISMTDDSFYRLKAGNLDILGALQEDPGKLATKSDSSAGSDQYDIVGRLIEMTTNKNVASYRGAATQEFLTCVLSDVALNAKNASTFYKNYSNIGQNIDNQRISISGVDTDDEAVNLLKYQNAYTLASKMIQTLTEVYDRLILQTGV